VRDEIVVAAVEHREGVLEPLGDVVGRQHGHGGRVGQTLGAHHRDVGVRDREDPGRAVRGGADRADALALAFDGMQRVCRQERYEVLRHRDRSDARPAAAVGDAERLVQVEVRHVAAEDAGLGMAEQRIEVGAVDIHLSPVAVDDVAQLGDAVLVHAVSRGIRHHDGREVVVVGLALGAQIVEVDLALIGRLDDDDAHTGHDGRALVPWAELGIRHTVRCSSPRLRW
jgi:hypothetical protein